jgi:hypothetical protein
MVSEQGLEHIINVRNNLLLKPEQDINIAQITYYCSLNKFLCRLEKSVKQTRTTIETKSYYSRNNFVCHLEQKQM